MYYNLSIFFKFKYNLKLNNILMEMAQSIHSVDSYNIIDEIDFGETIVFIKFGTDWCLPCKQIEQILVDMPNCITYTIDVENDEFEEFLSKNRI